MDFERAQKVRRCNNTTVLMYKIGLQGRREKEEYEEIANEWIGEVDEYRSQV